MMTRLDVAPLTAADYALLEADTTGVEKEVERLRREVSDGFYLAMSRQWIASMVDATPIPRSVRASLAQRIGGRGYRTSATTRRKYEKSAEANIVQDELPQMQTRRILASAENRLCFAKMSGIKVCQRKYVASVVSTLAPGGSLVEIGAGDLASLVGIAKVLEPRSQRLGAVDISEKRLVIGRQWSERQHVNVDVMCAANGASLPFADNQWDIVLTYQCLEQNSEPLDLMLRELRRVARQYLVLIEPSYELGNPVCRRSILRSGHVRGIPAVARQMGFDIIRHELLPVRAYISDLALTVLAKR